MVRFLDRELHVDIPESDSWAGNIIQRLVDSKMINEEECSSTATLRDEFPRHLFQKNEAAEEAPPFNSQSSCSSLDAFSQETQC